MRNVFMLSTAALILSAGVASAQNAASTTPAKAPAATAPAADRSSAATVNWGYRGNSFTGDEARFDRYRDSRAGMVAGANYNSESATSAFTFDAFNVGYHDQAYKAELNKFGKLKVSALFQGVPLNYAYNTLTPWQTTGDNVWTLDPATRLRVQNKEAGVLGIGTTAAQYGTPSIYNTIAKPFEIQSRRDILDFGLQYRLANSLNFSAGFNSQHRKGNQPWGAAFAFNNANELPLAIDDRNTDIKAGLEWTKPNEMLRVEWLGSSYKNQYSSLIWDSPLRATDYSNGKAPPAGPFDASGYSNGNGPAKGIMALAPSSKLNTFSLIGLHKLPGRTTLNGQVSYTKMTQNQDLLPWTTNANIANTAVYAFFPGLAQLPRQSAEAEIQAVNAQLNFVTRPTDYFSFDVRYKFNDRKNNTPAFDYSYNVRFDAVPEATPGESTVNYNVRRNTFETGATFNVKSNNALRLSYIMDDVKRTHRTFGNLTDYTFKASYDYTGNKFVTLRSVYENTKRVGTGFSEEAIEESGSQPGLYFYDEADMARNKGTVIVSVTPNEKFDATVSLATGKDDYATEEHKFGLLDNSNTSYNVDFNLYPAKNINLSANYGHEKFSALQAARNANPLTVPTPLPYESWNDPNRDWNLNNDETVKTYGGNVDFLKLVANTDIRLGYTASQSNNAFVFSGPRIREFLNNTALTSGDGLPCGTGTVAGTSCFSQFDPVTNKWQQFNATLSHTIAKKFGIDFGYQYEKLEIVDFATTNNANGTVRIDPLGAITTGYGNRPYTGSVFTAKVSYTFQSAPFLF